MKEIFAKDFRGLGEENMELSTLDPTLEREEASSGFTNCPAVNLLIWVFELTHLGIRTDKFLRSKPYCIKKTK